MAVNFETRRSELRGTATAWATENPVLLAGEWGIEIDTNKAKIGDGSTAWNSLPYFGGSTQDLQDVIAQDPIATSTPTFNGGVDMNGSTLELSNIAGDIQSIDASGGTITIHSDAYDVNVTADGGLTIENGVTTKNNSIVRLNNSTNDGYAQFRATNVTTGTIASIELRDGDIDLSGGSDGDVLTVQADGSLAFETPSDTTPTDAGTFSGEIDLTNRNGSFYDQYDLGTSGQITFSIATSPLTFAYSYIVVDSDGVTEFATKPNLDAIFNEQYNIPTDRILSEGLHTLYILKTPTGVALSIPANEYNPDIVSPTLSNYTINDTNPDRITFESSEVITGTTFGGFTLGSGKTVTGITINSGNTTGHYFTVNSAYVSGDGNDTIAYSGTGCDIEDLSGNALASFTATTVTNNVASAITFTLSDFTEISTNVYEKTSGTNSLLDGFAVSTTTVSGAFTYRVELASATNQGTFIGISTNGTNRAYNTAPAWNYGVQNNSTITIRAFHNGANQAIQTPPVAYGVGKYMEIRRDGSDNCTMWYDGVQYGSAFTVSGAVYLHFTCSVLGTQIRNPEIV